MAFEEKRVCRYCGKEFIATHPSQIYCKGKHFAKCVICGKEFEFNPAVSARDARKTCSKACSTKLKFINGNPGADPKNRAKALDTYKKKTGFDHPMHNPATMEKIRETQLERYGDEVYQNTDEYREKTIATNRERYGVDWHTQNGEVRDKITQSVREHYGVDNVSQADEVKAKIKQSTLEHTGYDHYTHNPKAMEQVKQANLERYGNEWAIASDEIRDKVRDTMIKRYGSPHFATSEDGKRVIRERMRTNYIKRRVANENDAESVLLDESKADKWLQFTKDRDSAISIIRSYDRAPTYRQLELDLGVSEPTLCYWLHKLQVTEYMSKYVSVMEAEVLQFIKSVDNEIEVITRCRSVIKNMELDLYIPSLKLGIECNPTYTHNSSKPTMWDPTIMPPSYHRSKTDAFEKEGVFVFHIFGYEWEHKREIMQSMLLSLMGKCRTIYARNCKVVELGDDSCRKFLNSNHRQGYVSSSVRIGLSYKDKLVAVMAFSNERPMVGKEIGDNCYELIRFCNALNVSVVGGAGKLFKYFLYTHSPNSVKSFSDKAHTRGGMYEQLGFTKIRSSEPGYVWVNSVTDIAYNRINANKQNISNFLHDDSIDLSKTEKQIMEEHGFVQVFDCGTILWEWKAENR